VTPRNYTDLPAEDTYQDIPIHRLEFLSANRRRIDDITELRREVVRIKQAFAPDLIHINGIGAINFFHLSTRDASGAPALVTLHNPWSAQEDAIATQTLRDADHINGVSAAILERARNLLPDITGRSSVIYNSVPPPLPEVHPLPFSPPHLLCLGRLAHDKGFDLAIAAFSVILRRFPNARLTIAGDGPLRHELEQQTDRMSLRHAVQFTGWVTPERTLSLMNEHTFVLMPSRQEPFGLVALEAALMGRPVVATRIGGLPEIVAHRKTGVLVESESVQQLADASIALLTVPEIAVEWGQAAKRRAQEVFDWERHLSQYDGLYRRLVS
jgi:glycogen(starch) synthase